MESRLVALHINDVASVGPILCESLISVGTPAKFYEFSEANPGSKMRSILWRFKRAWKILNEADTNAILHIHYFPNILFFFFTSRKIVLHAHGSDVRISSWNMPRRIFNYIACWRADHILYSTPDLRDFFKKFIAKTSFLPNPVFIPKSPAEKIDSSRAKKIFLFSTLTYIKGADLSLAALARFKRNHPDCQITIFNFGECFYESLENDFSLISRKRREDLPAILNAHGIILGQFKLEAIGMSELEAMAEGRPVIANFKYNCVYERPSPILLAASSSEIEQKLESIYGDSDQLNNLGEESRAWVKEYHEAANVAKRLSRIYEMIRAEAER